MSGTDRNRNGRKRNGHSRARVAAVASALGAASLMGAVTMAAPASAIIGGVDATEEYTFATALFDQDGVHYCGGSLIDEQWVLTAAHCSDPDLLDTENISVRVGSNDREEGGSEREVTEVVQHPDYEARDVSDDPDYPNSFLLVSDDISLLKLDSPVEQTPIRVAEERPDPGTPVRALGWGMVDDLGQVPKPETLQQLDTEIVSDERCDELHGDLCSEHPTEQAQVCSTDSGSPMVRESGGGWELVGLTSRDGAYEEDVSCVGPWVFTDAVGHADWAAETVGAQP